MRYVFTHVVRKDSLSQGGIPNKNSEVKFGNRSNTI